MKCPDFRTRMPAYIDGDLPQQEREALENHLAKCRSCHRQFDSLKQGDAALASLGQLPVPAGILNQARAEITTGSGLETLSEIMTLNEVAAFLKIDSRVLGDLVEQLPLFELAGNLRIRRQALLDWIRERERDFARTHLQGELSRRLGSTTIDVA